MAEFNTPEFFANGIPTLNQAALDKQFRYGKDRSNELSIANSQVRDALYNAGWGQKSDASRVLTGAGNYGIVSGIEGMGGSGFKTTTGQNASDEDFISAAQAAGIDPSSYRKKQPGGLGSLNATVLDRAKLYNALQEKGKDLYSVTNAVEGSKRGAPALHATVTYKADGNGNLVPVNNEQTGQPDVKYFNAVRYKPDPGIMGDLAPFLMLAPAVGGILGAAGSAAAGAGTAGTSLGLGSGAGLSTGTMAGTMLSGTGGYLGTTAGIAGGLAGTGALPNGAGVADDLGGLADDISRAPTGWENVSKEVGLGTPKATYIPPDVAKVIGSSSLLDQAKTALGPAKEFLSGAGDVISAAGALFGGGEQPVDGGGTGGGDGGVGMDGESGFLNKFAPSTKSAGILKEVNKESNVDPIDSDDEDVQTYKSAGTVKERNNQDYLEDSISGLNSMFCADNYFCMQKILNPKFPICDLPTFLYSTRQSSHNHPLKQLRQGLKVNALATGGLPHKYAAAAPKGHKPEFITGMTGYYACGGGTGQSDDIPAMLHDGDYVMDAETVSALGDGSSKAGHKVLEGFRGQIPHKKEGGGNPVPAKIADGEYVFPEAFVTALGGGDNKRGAEILDGLRTKLRAHKRGAPLDKIPPKAKNPIDYIKTGSK